MKSIPLYYGLKTVFETGLFLFIACMAITPEVNLANPILWGLITFAILIAGLTVHGRKDTIVFCGFIGSLLGILIFDIAARILPNWP